MGIISWIILGGLAGWIASMITNRNGEQGIIANIVVGIIGAFLGGLIMSLLGGSGVTGFNLYSLLVAIGGATVALLIYKAIRGRGAAEV